MLLLTFLGVFLGCFEQKLLDPEEKVRAAVCKALKQLELDVIKHQVPKSTLEKLSLRCKDKKVKALTRMNLKSCESLSICLYHCHSISRLSSKKH
jgi:hypothetical protein